MKIINNGHWDNINNILIPIIFSKSFLFELKRQIDLQLKVALGELFETNDFIIIVKYLPKKIDIDLTLKSHEISLMYYGQYSIICDLCWNNIKEKRFIEPNEDIDANVKIWLEGVDFEYLKKDLIKSAYLKRKVILVDYRFPVIIKKANLDCFFKINLKNENSEIDSINIGKIIAKYIATYNENSQIEMDGFAGLIHSFRSEKSKIKNLIMLKLDLGSAGDIGLKYLFNEFDKSELEILKIEVEGI
jgi:hypothetical protein